MCDFLQIIRFVAELRLLLRLTINRFLLELCTHFCARLTADETSLSIQMTGRTTSKRKTNRNVKCKLLGIGRGART